VDRLSAYRVPSPNACAAVRLSHWLVIGLIVAVVYTLVRNLL
jgi:hypothetical protein